MMQMKLFIDEQDFVFSSELIILYGLLKTPIQEPSHCYNFQGISRYEGLKPFCEENITYVDTVEDGLIARVGSLQRAFLNTVVVLVLKVIW